MSEPTIIIPLHSLGPIAWSPRRRREPLTFGMPFPRGAVTETARIALAGPEGLCPIQVRALDTWPDGSVRWASIDAAIDAEAGGPDGYAIHIGSNGAGSRAGDPGISASPDGATVSTPAAKFSFRTGGAFPIASVEGAGTRQGTGAAIDGVHLRIDDRDGVHACSITGVDVRESGPLRAELAVRGAVAGMPHLEVFARVEMFAGTATVRLDVTVRNTRRAHHPEGKWPLGDDGSALLRSARLVMTLGGPAQHARCAAEPGAPLADVSLPFEILQESSGGDRWDGPVHRNRNGIVPLRFRGYRVRSAATASAGHRASPVVVVKTASGEVAVSVPRFWQNFPQAIAVGESSIDIALLPETADVHELQGGEQTTHTVVVAFDGDTVSDPPLAWTHDPAMLYPSPAWCCDSQAIPFLTPAPPRSASGQADHEALINLALDPAKGFAAKREVADEYGWRHFGDLHADHESAFLPEGQPPFVSHYNNQYDAVAGFAIHFLRTGDPRWWRLSDDLARHVRDIDIYHTREDKAAYNGGLFWHTNHYVDAGTATHRTYPRERNESGGPSGEHNYNAGLMWHYFMTGDRASRDAAVGLARWVVDMDDGRLTPFRWLTSGRTGLASAAGSMTYHGPGRGGANSLLACLVGYQLTADALYLAKADELIRRCVHPDDDVDAQDLLDVERRWFYTVFLQSVGAYLQMKSERQAFDEMFAYARASLLHYARWMVTHERPYLSVPEILEHKTETWAAQDMRKAEVFLWAAMHTDTDERATFLERADFFRRYSIETLNAMPGRHFTRPLVLMLSNGIRWVWVQARMSQWPPPVPAPVFAFPAKRPFEPQKVTAIRRAKAIVMLTAAITVGAVLWAIAA